jgi:hypothetical protein
VAGNSQPRFGKSYRSLLNYRLVGRQTAASLFAD